MCITEHTDIRLLSGEFVSFLFGGTPCSIRACFNQFLCVSSQPHALGQILVILEVMYPVVMPLS